MTYAEIMNWLTVHWNFCSWMFLAATALLLLGSMPLLFRPRRKYFIHLPQPVRQPVALDGQPSTQRARQAPRS
jgi:hypothetical protein